MHLKNKERSCKRAREFGKYSYNPENISFVMNGMVGKNREPWNYISRSLCKNILLAAYRNPATAEELAMEVGVALPYMEEELSSLVDATLMKKIGNKYETNFFIVSADAQEKIYSADTDQDKLNAIKEYNSEVKAAADEAEKRGQDYMSDYFSDMGDKFDEQIIHRNKRAA